MTSDDLDHIREQQNNLSFFFLSRQSFIHVIERSALWSSNVFYSSQSQYTLLHKYCHFQMQFLKSVPYKRVSTKLILLTNKSSYFKITKRLQYLCYIVYSINICVYPLLHMRIREAFSGAQHFANKFGTQHNFCLAHKKMWKIFGAFNTNFCCYCWWWWWWWWCWKVIL